MLSSGAVARRVESVKASSRVFSSASFEFESNSLMNTSLLAVVSLVSTCRSPQNAMGCSPVGIKVLNDDSHQPCNITLYGTDQLGSSAEWKRGLRT